MLLDLAVVSSGTITRPVDANTAFPSPLYFKLAEQCLDCLKQTNSKIQSVTNYYSISSSANLSSKQILWYP